MPIGPTSNTPKPLPPPPKPEPLPGLGAAIANVADTVKAGAAAKAPEKATAQAVKDGFDAAKTATTAPAIAGAVGGVGGALQDMAVKAKPPANLPPVVSGEDKAKQELEIQTVAKDRVGVEDAQKALKSETAAKGDELFDMADGKKDKPPHTEVKKNSDSQVEMLRHDDQGALLERTLATRGKDGAVTLDSASFEGGVNRREQSEVREDGGTRVQRAEWKSDTNEVRDLKSFDDLGKARDPGIKYTDNSVSKKDDTLQVEQYEQSGGAVSGSRTEYFQQKGDKGIDDKLEGHFDFDKPVDRADTYTYSIPATGADGKQPEAQYQRTQRFAQENYQTTSVVDTALKDEPRNIPGPGFGFTGRFYKDAVKAEPHNREDLTKIRDHNVKIGNERRFDANDAQEKGQPPKRWHTEWKNGPDELRTQTGVEGFPKATVVTDRKREGDTVSEKYAGKTFKPDSKDLNDLVDVGGESKHKYGQDGSLETSDLRRVNADGSKEEQHYKSTTEQTKDGLIHNESTESKFTTEGKTTTALKEDKSRVTKDNIELLGTKTTMTGPDGKQAVSSLDETGEKLTLSGPDGKDPRDVTDPAAFQNDADGQDLALKAATSSVETARSYVNHVGVKALDAMEYLQAKVGDVPLPKGVEKAFGMDRINDSLTEVRDARTGVKMASNALGAASGAMNLAAGIRSGNKGDIIAGALSTAWGAGNLVSDGMTVLDRIKGNNPYDKSFVDKLASPALESLGRSSSAGSAIVKTIEKMGGASRALGAIAGPGLDIFGGAMDIKKGIDGGHTGQIAKGAVGIAGGLLGGAAAIALSGPAAVIVAPLIGLGAGVIGSLIEAITDDKHQISELSIDDDGFEVKPPDYDAAAPAPPPEPTPEEKKAAEDKKYQEELEAYYSQPLMIS